MAAAGGGGGGGSGSADSGGLLAGCLSSEAPIGGVLGVASCRVPARGGCKLARLRWRVTWLAEWVQQTTVFVETTRSGPESSTALALGTPDSSCRREWAHFAPWSRSLRVSFHLLASGARSLLSSPRRRSTDSQQEMAAAPGLNVVVTELPDAAAVTEALSRPGLQG